MIMVIVSFRFRFHIPWGKGEGRLFKLQNMLASKTLQTVDTVDHVDPVDPEVDTGQNRNME